MLKFSYGDNFPPLISTHAARFEFCILNTLHACHTNFTLILTHSSTPFLPLHLATAILLSVAITHPFKLSSLWTKTHYLMRGDDVVCWSKCPLFFHWWLQAHHVCERMTKSSNMWMFTKNCDSVLRLLDAAGLRSKARLSRLYFFQGFHSLLSLIFFYLRLFLVRVEI